MCRTCSTAELWLGSTSKRHTALPAQRRTICTRKCLLMDLKFGSWPESSFLNPHREAAFKIYSQVFQEAGCANAKYHLARCHFQVSSLSLSLSICVSLFLSISLSSFSPSRVSLSRLSFSCRCLFLSLSCLSSLSLVSLVSLSRARERSRARALSLSHTHTHSSYRFYSQVFQEAGCANAKYHLARCHFQVS